MSFEEKIAIFSNATHIVGPLSSGFANLFFTNRPLKILGFFNFNRCFDPFLSAWISSGDLRHNLTVLTGSEFTNNDLNSSYFIPLSEIQEYCNQNNFFDEII